MNEKNTVHLQVAAYSAQSVSVDFSGILWLSHFRSMQQMCSSYAAAAAAGAAEALFSFQ